MTPTPTTTGSIYAKRIAGLTELLLPPGAVTHGWEDQAACQGMETEWFYPDRGESHHEQRTVCELCPVRRECLTVAVERREKFGVWGGTSERQRRDLRAYLRRTHSGEVAA